ncbi:MAG: 30S ribosomal protein S6 [Candidatus Aureabacteria bacterium]|nr:30S ribosomal protein S6 [Candidatus Auribacterota bacterium]
MSLYEGMFIIDGKIADDDVQKATSQIEEQISSNNGKVIENKSIGRRQLAYEIKGCTEGTYVLIDFELNGVALKPIQEKLKLDQEILRSLILKKN